MYQHSRRAGLAANQKNIGRDRPTIARIGNKDLPDAVYMAVVRGEAVAERAKEFAKQHGEVRRIMRDGQVLDPTDRVARLELIKQRHRELKEQG